SGRSLGRGSRGGDAAAPLRDRGGAGRFRPRGADQRLRRVRLRGGGGRARPPLRARTAGGRPDRRVGPPPRAVRSPGRFHRPHALTSRTDAAMSRHERPYENVLDVIGWTPLIRIGSVAAGIRTPVYG